ncbi:MAG: sulfotransferase [Rhodobacteraceae bacterium]|nr:sulfotransferase [Paracoccaceae bacterium]
MVAQIDSTYIRMRPTRLWSRLLSYVLFEGRPLTTRGRWINPLVFAHFAIEKRLPQMKAVKAPVFILGTGRSGTTILGVLLSMHRDVGFLNEPKALWHAVHGGEDLVGSYTRDAAQYRLPEADAKTRRNAHRLFGAYLRVTFNRQVIDKYQALTFRIPFIKSIFPDARFIFLSRNGWDTCSSIERWSQIHGQTVDGEVHDWWGADRRKWHLLIEQIIPEHPDLAPHKDALLALQDHRSMAAVEWITTMREGLQLTEREPERALHVPYESLCQSPAATARQLAKFAGLRDDKTFIDYAEIVLSPRPTCPPFPLPDYLEAPFHATQAALDSFAKET